MKSAIAITVLCAIFVSCQRGEDDPVFSVIPRKSRLAGTWTVKTFEGEITGISQSFDGTTMTYTDADSIVTARPFTWEFSFDKEGKYTITTTEDFSEDTLNHRMAYTRETVEQGHWEFTGGNSTPSKSQLLLLATEVKVTESDQGSNVNVVSIEGPSSGTVYDIKRLSSDELVLVYEEVEANAFGQLVNKGELNLKKQ